MKQSSLMSFFGSNQKKKKVEEVDREIQTQELLEKRPDRVNKVTSVSADTSIGSRSSSKKSITSKEERQEAVPSGILKRNSLKKLKYSIDSDEENEEEEEEQQPQIISKAKMQENKEAKKKTRFRKTKIDDDEDFDEKEIQQENESDVDLENEEEDDDDFIESDGDDDEFGGSNKKKQQKKVKASLPKKPIERNPKSTSAQSSKGKQTPKFGEKSASKNDENQFISCDKENDQERGSINQLEDTTPTFALPGKALDSQRRKCTDPNYDATTLYVPPEEFKKFTPVMKQYWEIKSKNFDKIIFFKLGKFYELFYEDALIAHKELDLNWMGKKMHNGFPEKVLDKMATKLVQRGYKVAVAEQTETPTQMQKRISTSGGAKCVNRELTQVMTKGTYEHGIEQDHQPRYLLALRNFQTYFGIAIVESSTNVITLAFLKDDLHFTQLKTLLTQVKAQEIVYDPDNMTYDIKKIINSSYLAPQLSPLQNKTNNWNKGMTFNFLDKVYGDVSEGKWPTLLQSINKSDVEIKKSIQFEALAGLFSYLKSILILDQVISVARYQIYDMEKGIRSSMILDSQSLQHLEIIESSSAIGSGNAENGKKTKVNDGSLLGYIDRTSSPFGSRLLKNWLCAPLMDVQKINDRYDSIEDLQTIHNERDEFLRGLSKIPDLEKACGRMYKYSIKQQNTNVVYFEDISLQRLKEFKDLLARLAEVDRLIRTHFTPFSNQFKSKRLRKLVTLVNDDSEKYYDQPAMIYHGYSDEEELENDRIREHADNSIEIENFQKQTHSEIQGMLPLVGKYIKEFDNFIQWVGPKGAEKPVPKRGILQSYDAASDVVQAVEQKLQNYLETIQRQMKDKTIKYGLRYEIEIHEDLLKGNKKPANFDFTSKSGKYQRFQTSELRKLIGELDETEEIQKKQMKEFCTSIFAQFYESYRTWDSLVSIAAEIDCLSSLSRVSFTLADGIMCRPQLFPKDNKQVPFLELIQARHPCLTAQGVNFIPNDVILGDMHQRNKIEDNKSLILLTGPNMGGKSTTLRMVCVATILAQIGCYVPAKELKMSLVDRIFTRIGASDKLMEGKSTFFIEMEETSNAVKQGTKHSLIIMDELGRGTSTFDGVAIAYSILRYLIENLQSRCLFATHYHVLLDEFRHYPQMAYYHMACHVDDQRGKVIFLYKLKQGECSSSFGINVARVVGIEENLLQIAKVKAKEFEDNLSIQHSLGISKRFNLLIKVIEEYNRNDCVLDQLIDQFNKISLLS